MSDQMSLMQDYKKIKDLGLNLNIQRGQPADGNFDICNGLLDALDTSELVTPSGIAIRNYPGGPAGLKEAREILSEIISVNPEECIAGNNSSLKMLSNLIMWAMVKGVKDSPEAWSKGEPSIIVTVPGYDRHFTLLETAGIDMISVKMQGDGPDLDKIEELAADKNIKGLVFVPVYSNPTGETISAEKAERLASMKTAAPDFTIFADNAYAVHHLEFPHAQAPNLLEACKKAGNPDRIWLFGSTSKITFSGAGIGIMGASEANIAWYLKLLTTQFIGPDKINQYRHVRFIKAFPGGIEGIMKKHAEILKPKFDAVHEILEKNLGGTGLAFWTDPKGGYFVSLDTSKPVASRVVELMNEAGVTLTPAGATFPYKKDPDNSNIRIAPTRLPLADLKKAMEILCLCIKIASAE